MVKELGESFALVRRSKNRKKILAYLENKVRTPSEIAKNTNIDNSHVSKHLKVMKEANLIVCLNEKDTQGRLHKTRKRSFKMCEKRTIRRLKLY